MGRDGRILLGPVITRDHVIERAESWLRPSVPYSQTDLHGNSFGRYRMDCSGYVSMAWGLPGYPPHGSGGLNTVGLATVSVRVDRADLLPGDVLIRSEGTNSTRHVAIFERWVDRSHDAYWGFEQVGGVGTVHRVVDYPYDAAHDLYVPRRYVHIAR